MKNAILFLVFSLSLIALSAQQQTTFEVCKVERAQDVKPEVSFREAVEARVIEPVDPWRASDEADKENAKKADRKIEDFAQSKDQLIETGFHPLMWAVHMAYAEHRPLVLSPDMIWLLITQGFAVHVTENAEELRSQFVDFEGKKVLFVKRDQFRKGSTNNAWEGVFPEFTAQMEQYVDKGLLDLVQAKFSTTGAIEKAAFEVTLMDAMSKYFVYSVGTTCGIPEITLEGTVEDWKAIEEKAAQLAQYDLDWWIDDLQPLLKKFTKAAKGKRVDKKFWSEIYKLNSVGSGSHYITGWILKFFPYLTTPRRVWKNPILADNGSQSKKAHITTKMFPSGLSKAKFIWDYFDTKYNMEFLAGFVGVSQDKKSLALRPEISWVVMDAGGQPNAEGLKLYEEWKKE